MGAPTVAATLGQVDCPLPAEPPPLGRGGGRRWPQRPDRGRLPGQGGAVGAGAGTARAPWRACTEQPFADPGPGQPVCLCGRPARPHGRGRARPGALRLQGVRRRPQPLGPLRRRHLGGPVRRPRPDRGPPARQPLRRARHPGDAGLRGHVRPAAPGPADRATPGRATPPPATSSPSGSATTPSCSRSCSRSRSPTLDRYVDDQRMKDALYGQGVIGAWAPQPGLASSS